MKLLDTTSHLNKSKPQMALLSNGVATAARPALPVRSAQPKRRRPPMATFCQATLAGAAGAGMALAPRRVKTWAMASARSGSIRSDSEMETVLAALHPALAEAVRKALRSMPKAETLLIGPKEEIGGVKGVPFQQQDLPPRSLRELPHDCYDLVVEVQSEEVSSPSWEAVQNRFYPLGGHAFSLANDFIINLASISKVLRNGGKFLFLSAAESQDEVLPCLFLNLPHLKWQVHFESETGSEAAGVSVVCCTVDADANAESLKLTPKVIAEQCTAEMSRKRYFEALRPFLKREDAKMPRILDYGCGDGSLMSWAVDPQIEAIDGSRDLTLVEANRELAARAQSKLPTARVIHQNPGEPWPFVDNEFDTVVLAFVLHHVPINARAALLVEAQRCGQKVLVLEDLPDEAKSADARRLAWLVTEEHFRPFGQNPDDFVGGVLSRKGWTQTFEDAGFRILESKFIEPSLRYPVPHILFELEQKYIIRIGANML